MTTPLPITPLSLPQALELLKQPGGVVCFQLNGRYVLSCDPEQDEAVQRINQLKGRKPGRPLAMIFADLEHALKSPIHSPLLHLLPTFAPLITVSVASPPGVSRFAHQGVGMIGIGLSDNGVARELLKAWGAPLLVSSANPTGEPSPLSYEQVRTYGFDVPLFGDNAQGCEEPPRVTVVGLSHYEPKALSEGCVTQAQLNAEWARLKSDEVI